MLRQAYLVRKLHQGQVFRHSELKLVQLEINEWHKDECEKIKMQFRTDEVNASESVRIYHHELHKKHIKKSAILKLETEIGTKTGHEECSKYLENLVGQLLLQPAILNEEA